MTRPTDDELERVAKDCTTAAQVMRETGTFETGQSILDESAAMLRAMKGRVRVKPYKRHGSMYDYRIYDVHQGNKYGICSAFLERDQWGSRVQVAKCVPPEAAKAAVQADYEARILAALEPAPDHSDWNAAIEAAADACMSAIGGVTHYGSEPYEICAAAIRALKKGPPQ